MSNPLKLVKPFVVKHEPELLMAMGISGLVFSAIWGVRATFKVSKLIEDYKREHNLEKLTPKEYFKLSWKWYLPSVLSAGLSIPCVICGNRVSSKRYAALATAYTISETALQEYKDQAINIVGEKKAKQIQEASNAKVIEKTYTGQNQIIMTNNNETMFYEPTSGRYFWSTWNDISRAANELNARALGEVTGYITLNDWYDALHLPPTEIGDMIGWSLTAISGGANLIDIEISSHMTPDNVPCGAISYRRQPMPLKSSLY